MNIIFYLNKLTKYLLLFLLNFNNNYVDIIIIKTFDIIFHKLNYKNFLMFFLFYHLFFI